jgi:hypothetical protein
MANVETAKATASDKDVSFVFSMDIPLFRSGPATAMLILLAPNWA